MLNNEQFYTIQELADMWKMKVGFIRKEIRNGKLECKHFGRSVRVSQKQLAQYMENFVN